MQNVFIAIIQVGYSTLKTEPVEDYDDSSDEEEKRVRVESEKRMISRK